MKRGSLLFLIACVPLASGCEGSGEERGAIAGELGQGVFYYQCATESDGQCDEKAVRGEVDETTGSFPSVAVGGEFSIEYVSNTDQGANATYSLVATSDFVTFAETVLTAQATGITALVATDVNGYAEDLAHVRFETATKIRVSQTETAEQVDTGFAGGVSANVGGTDIEIDVGSTLNLPGRSFLRVVPTTDDGRILAGALPCTWSTGTPDAVRIVSSASNNVVDVEISGPGQLVVKLGDLEQTVVVGGSTP
ncbi:hypothetical protein [Chondromyces apiculatus]|uniref:Lipoprotein n=1 Tax=Chondromyces apiculatus DSM 436 TaxID=1192034 RepID=A0A017T7X1_9BACT|nr:hypothetical protein [Chondromyces apiculatus]EYF04910.1 Hypothetical protein CAP_3721 [Chondromyces apiculatus DSM 436]